MKPNISSASLLMMSLTARSFTPENMLSLAIRMMPVITASLRLSLPFRATSIMSLMKLRIRLRSSSPYDLFTALSYSSMRTTTSFP